MQKKICLIAFVIGAILSAQSVKAQSSEQKLHQQIQKKKQEVADMQQKLATQRQQRLVERIPPPPVSHNTNAKTEDHRGEAVSNASGGQPIGGSTSDPKKSQDTKKDAAKNEEQ